MANAEPEVTLAVNGKLYEGWKQVSVRSSLEELAHSFTVEYTQRAAVGAPIVEIEAGDAVQIKIGATLVLTGYVDESSEDYDSGNHSVSVIGRSKTGDLVDCAAILEQPGTPVPGQPPQGGKITGKNLYDIAKLLCAPFGIGVSIDAALSDMFLSAGNEAAVQIQDGDSVFETLSELARKDAVLLLTDAAGDLLLARASTVPLSVALRSGVNIKRGSLRSSVRDRYSKYVIKGQAPGSDALAALSATGMKFEVADDEVKRYRPFVAVDHEATLERLEQRATWERNTRAGRSAALTYDVQGWTHAQGLWHPNTLVTVGDERLGIDTTMLITSVDLQRSLEQGRTARLELAPREMYDVLKPPKVLRRKKGDLSKLLAGVP
jgi:prophage tail gpP-like protein